MPVRPAETKAPVSHRESVGYVDMGAAMKESANPGSGFIGGSTPAGKPTAGATAGGGSYVDQVGRYN